jgi:hypothetical protein
MFDISWVAELDAEQACASITATQGRLRENEWRELVLAAHWATLHDAETVAGPTSTRGGSGRSPGGERIVHPGGDGTPEVAEFACAEFGMLMGCGFIAASTLIRDALDLQHRHPLMWQALGDGKARVWKARQVARMTHAAGLSWEQARFVDEATTPYVDTLVWSTFTRLVEARIIEADPEAAEARRVTAELERFVSTGRSNEFGLKTLIARATAGEVIYFVAMCDRIAQILAEEGDGDCVEVRRSKALAILANPARALPMLMRYASSEPHPLDPDRSPLGQDGQQDQDDADHADPVDDADHADPVDDAGGTRPMRDLDPEKLRPRAVLYVRISEEALRSATGVAHCEGGVGPVTVQQVRDLLGHYHVTVRPVLDLRGQVPVDAYEVPHAMREALRLARPSSVFPFSRSGSASPDWDHTRPYLDPAHGGPPGQTRTGNLGPMVRFGHRVKTHGRGWRVRQPSPGTYLWRTPHGYWFRVDNDGTHALGRDPDLTAREPAEPAELRTAMERAFADLIATF